MVEIYFTFPFIVKIYISIRYNSSKFLYSRQFNPRFELFEFTKRKEEEEEKGSNL